MVLRCSACAAWCSRVTVRLTCSHSAMRFARRRSGVEPAHRAHLRTHGEHERGEGMIYARIAGTGSYPSGEPVSNDDLVKRGIDTRPTSGSSAARHPQSPSGGGRYRGERPRPRRGRARDRPPAAKRRTSPTIIVATSTPDYIFPSTADSCSPSSASGTAAPPSTCRRCRSGFIYALSVAEKFIRLGQQQARARHRRRGVLAHLDWSDRGTCVRTLRRRRRRGRARGPERRASWLRRCTPTAATTPSRACGHCGLGQVIGDPFLRMDGRPCSSSRSRYSAMWPTRC